MEKVIAVMTICRACGKSIYFSTHPGQRPDIVHHKHLPLDEADKVAGAQTSCEYCGTINELYLEWTHLPPSIQTKAPDEDSDFHGKWKPE